MENMDEISLTKNGDRIIIEFPQTKAFNDADLQWLLEIIKGKLILNKSKAKKKDIDKLAEDIKANWWKENKSRFINE